MSTRATLASTFPYAVCLVPRLRIHVDLYPLPASEKVEQIYQISLAPKEKEGPSKRASYKSTARKEQPLFDVNPRIAREFLTRSRLETGNARITFQLPNEEFTQWKEEEKVATKTEQTPEVRPTSFAEALLRKLNIAGEEEGGPKGLHSLLLDSVTTLMYCQHLQNQDW